MAAQLRLSAPQLADLAAIRDLGEARLETVVAALEQGDPPPLTTAELGRIFDDTLPGESVGSASLLTQALSLAGLMRQRGFSADEVLEGLTYGLRSAIRPWREDEIVHWERLAPRFRQVFAHPKVQRVAKALDLSYDFANLLQDARIVTDIRPVFDESAETVEAAVVSFTLRLSYSSTDRGRNVSVAMNEQDVLALRKECDRSLRKAEILKRTMEVAPQIRTIVSGRAEEVD